MKKMLSLILCMAMVLTTILISACNKPVETTAAIETTEATTTEAVVTTEATTTEAVVTTEATTEEVTTEEETTEVEEPLYPTTESLKILAIGNSYSQDTTQYVYNIAQNLGYKDIVVANLYVGGCSLEQHKQYIYNKAYDYEYNNNGSWVNKGKVCINDVVPKEDWDIITLQQKSGYSGLPETYEPFLSNLIAYLKEAAPNAKIYWNMTWAYQANSTETNFSKYGKNQMVMYDAIINTVKTKVLVKDKTEIFDVIPVGTAVQNMRTSFYGDNLFRDSLHLNYGVGRYLAALMWMKQITGMSIDEVKWVPSVYDFSEKELAAIKESVNNAYEHPYEITESQYKVGQTFDDILAKYNIDASKYKELELEIELNSYYNSTAAATSTKNNKTNSTASNITQFASTQIFEKADIPNGSLILSIEKYQYRPEGWTDLKTKNSSSSRPGNVTDNIVVVDDTWWGSFKYRAFNIAKEGNPNLIESEMEKLTGVLKILVPIDSSVEPPVIGGKEVGADIESIVTAAGYDMSKYKVLDFDVEFYAYYNSTASSSLVAKSTGSTASNLNQFAATSKIFSKSEIPVGSLIVLVSGYQYRPEGWTTLSAKNSSSTRPANVTKQVVEVTNTWWGSFNYRAFNIAKAGNPALSDSQMKQLDSVFYILVPNGK